MTNTTKRSLIIIIALLLLGSILLSLFLCNILNKNTENGIIIENDNNMQDLAHRAVNGYNGNYEHQTNFPTSAVAISNGDELANFIKGTATYGYLTTDIDFDWNKTAVKDRQSSTTEEEFRFKSGRTLDGNGYSVNIINYTAIKMHDYKGGTSNDGDVGPTLPDILNTGVGIKGLNSETSAAVMKIAGGVVDVNEGTIKNTKFVWNSTLSTVKNDSFWSTSFGLVVGYNTGTIENCSITVAKPVTYEVHYTYSGGDTWGIGKKLWTMRHSIGTYGGLVGTCSAGRILNCKIALNQNFSITASGDLIEYSWPTKYGSFKWVRLWVGGLAGVAVNNSVVYNSTATGHANISANCTTIEQGQNSIFSASGILVGSSAKADGEVPDRAFGNDNGKTNNGGPAGRESITSCYKSGGIIDGAMIYWDGNATMNHGTASGWEINDPRDLSKRINVWTKSYFRSYTGQGENTVEHEEGEVINNNVTITSKGIVAGLVGNYGNFREETIENLEAKHIYYVNYSELPKMTFGRSFGVKTHFYRGEILNIASPSESDVFLSLDFDENHKVVVHYDIEENNVLSTTDVNGIPTDYNFRNKIIWNVGVNKNTENINNFELFRTATGLKEINTKYDVTIKQIDSQANDVVKTEITQDEFDHLGDTFLPQNYEIVIDRQYYQNNVKLYDVKIRTLLKDGQIATKEKISQEEYDKLLVDYPEKNNVIIINKKYADLAVPGFQNWASKDFTFKYSEGTHDNGIPDVKRIGAEATPRYENATYTFKPELGKVVTFKPIIEEQDGIVFIDGNKTTVQYKDKTFDGKASFIPKIELFKDLGCNIPINGVGKQTIVSDLRLYNYKASNVAVENYQIEYASNWKAKFVGDQAEQYFVIDKETLNDAEHTYDYNYIAVQADMGHMQYEFTRTVNPKPIKYTLSSTQVENIYSASEIQINTEIDAQMGLIANYEDVRPILIYERKDGNGTVNKLLNVGEYTVKLEMLDGLHSMNYIVDPSQMTYDVSITPCIIEIQNDPIAASKLNSKFVYDGLKKNITFGITGTEDIHHSAINGEDPLAVFTYEYMNVAPTQEDRATDVDRKEAGYFRFDLTLINKNYVIKIAENEFVDRLSYNFEIRPAVVTMELGDLKLNYNGQIQELTVGRDKATSHIHVLGVPENGSVVDILTPDFVKNEAIPENVPGRDVGSYDVNIILDDFLCPNYVLDEIYPVNENGERYVTLNVTINKKTINILPGTYPDLIADHKKKVYDGLPTAIHEIFPDGIIFDPFIENVDLQLLEPDLQYKVMKGTEYVDMEHDAVARNAGKYQLVLGVKSPSISRNYTIVPYTGFKFEITKKPISVTLEKSTLEYGDPLGKVKYSSSEPIYEGDEVYPVFNPIASVNPGKYSVELKGWAGKDADSYEITCTNPNADVLEIVKKNIQLDYGFIGFNPGTSMVEYDGTEKTATVTVNYGMETWAEGLEKCKVVLVSKSLSPEPLSALPPTDQIIKVNAGSYEVQAQFADGTLENEFFILPQETFTFQITPKDVNVSIDPIEGYVYGNVLPVPNFKGVGFIDTEVDNIVFVPYFTTTEDGMPIVGSTLNPGNYFVKATLQDKEGNEINNYNLIFDETCKMTSSKRDITVTINEQQFTYSDAITKFNNKDYTSDVEFVGEDANDLVLITSYQDTMVKGDAYTISLDLSTLKNVDFYNVTVADVNMNVVAKKVTVTVEAPVSGLVYDAKAKAVVVTGEGLKPEDYYVTYNGQKEAPIDVLKDGYVIKVVMNNTNLDTVIEGLDTLVIEKKPVNFVVKKDTLGKKKYGDTVVTYAEPQNMAAPATPDDDFLGEDASAITFSYVFTGADESITEDCVELVLNGAKANNYAVTTTQKGNIEVIKNDLQVTIKESSNNKTYSGEAIVPEFEGVIASQINVFYKTADTEYVNIVEDPIIDAGTYFIKVVVKPEVASNYNPTELEIATPFVVNKKVIDVTPINTSLIYGDAAPTTLYDEDKITAQLATKDQMNGITLTSQHSYNPVKNNVGDTPEIIYAIVVGDDKNYEISESTAKSNFTIAKRVVSVKAINVPENLVYDGSAKAITVDFTTMINGEPQPFEVRPEQIKLTYGIEGVVEAKNVGNYVIGVELVDTTNLEFAEAAPTKEITITPATINATLTAKTNIVYNGEAQTLVDIVIDDVITADEYVIVYKQADQVVDNINAGKYQVSIEIKPDYANNYVLNANTVEAEIAKLKVSVAVEGKQGLAYTGETQVLANVVFTPEIKTSQYKLTYMIDNKAVDAIDAGIYQVYVEILDKNNLEYSAIPLAIPVEIKKVVGDISNAKNELKINGNYNKITITGSTVDKYEFSLNGYDWIVDNVFEGTIKPQSTYKVFVRTIEDKNHIASESVKLGSYTTGHDPTKINNIINTIDIKKFKASDIAKVDQIEEMIKDIKAEDMSVISSKKLADLRQAKKDIIAEYNDVVSESQAIASKAAGKGFAGAATAAVATSLSLAGIALAIAKKKMLL